MNVGDLTPTEDQHRALREAVRTRDDLIINGFAGTGKTTILWLLAQEFGQCVFLAPTGKAARRVTDVTGFQTQTIHSWLYRPVIDEVTWDVTFVRRTPEEMETYGLVPEGKVAIVDECSMLTEEINADLRDVCGALGIRIIYVGDEFQLPPISNKGTDTFSVFTSGIRQVKLTQVVRQALDSSVLRAATAIREGRVEEGLDTLITLREETIPFFAPHPDSGIVLCHRNDTRHTLNERIRRIYGYGGAVSPGEPVIVNKNNYRLEWLNGDVFPFGEIIRQPKTQRVTWKKGYGQGVVEETLHLTYLSTVMGGQKVILCGEELLGMLPKDMNQGFIQYGAIAWAFNNECIELAEVNEKQVEAPFPFVHANLGWSLTCHKAQGSQWDVVMIVLEPSVNLKSNGGRRWMYTAITRAVKSAVLVPVWNRLGSW